MRKLRFIPEQGSLVEVTCRTIHGRPLLRPDAEVCDTIVGVLGMAQELYPVEVCGVVFASTHYHMLLVAPNAKLLSGFMGYVNGNIARKVGRLVDWKEKFWSRRYQAIVVSQEEEAQVGRLKYLLSHGCKENLVTEVREWPGVHCVHALLDGKPLSGYWFNRTKESAARLRGEQPDRLAYADAKEIKLSPLPCWRPLDPEEVRERVADLVEQIEKEAALARESKNVPALGVPAILEQDPHAKPERIKRSPAPLVHAATKRVRDDLRQAYALFVLAYREAAERLKAEKERWRGFPEGSFPPAPPFVMSPWAA